MNKSNIKIVILDGHALNPGDLGDWDALRAIGQVELYPVTPIASIPSRAADAVVVITNKVVLSRETLRQLPCLKYIGVPATGVNIVDLLAARELGITVTNVPKYSTESVAQLTIAHILNLSFHLSQHIESVRNGDWSRNENFCYRLTPMLETSGKTLGIVGFGEIGRATARIAQSLGMNILVYTPSRCQHPGDLHSPCARELFGASRQEILFVDFDALLSESDFVSLHCPLTDSNHQMLSRERIARMKPTAFVINTARGLLIDEAALADALNEKRIAGAGLDVLSQEPPLESNPLLTANNCYISPHSAWGTREARLRLMEQTAANLRSFFDGNPIHVVD
ncbi:MAG: D-2-hydroxyacid dehydrogenase [Planctomycetaceae bacterium]|jgi:glycerate dehydrogenase|nr:D-2-hydroxyacid dehydrogenase [Planctomycetaceae bacterium]